MLIIIGGTRKTFSLVLGNKFYTYIHTHTHTHKHTPGRRPGKSVKFCHWEQVTWTCLVTVRLKYIIIYNINIYTHKYTDTHTQLLAVTKDK